MINYLKYSANVYYDKNIVENIFERLKFTISKADFKSITIIAKSLNNLKINNQEFLDEIYLRFEKIIDMNLVAQKKKVKIGENNKITVESFINCVNYLNNMVSFSFEKHLEYERLIINCIDKEGIQSIYHLINFIYLHQKLEIKLNLKLKESSRLKEKRFLK